MSWSSFCKCKSVLCTWWHYHHRPLMTAACSVLQTFRDYFSNVIWNLEGEKQIWAGWSGTCFLSVHILFSFRRLLKLVSQVTGLYYKYSLLRRSNYWPLKFLLPVGLLTLNHRLAIETCRSLIIPISRDNKLWHFCSNNFIENLAHLVLEWPLLQLYSSTIWECSTLQGSLNLSLNCTVKLILV